MRKVWYGMLQRKQQRWLLYNHKMLGFFSQSPQRKSQAKIIGVGTNECGGGKSMKGGSSSRV
jgi:hypothetical protein